MLSSEEKGLKHLWIAVFVLMLHCSHGMTRADSFYFRSWPEDSRPCVGAPLRLACSVSDSTLISLRWTKDKKQIRFTERVNGNDAGLVIRKVLPQDSGRYACIAYNTSSGFALTSLPANIEVLWVASRTSINAVGRSKNYKPKSGDSLVLRCRVSGGPGLSYTWYRNGNELKNVSSSGRKRLVLPKMKGRRHNGMYTCSASLSALKLTRNDPVSVPNGELCDGRHTTKISTPYLINVTDDAVPQILKVPESILGVGGKSVSFTCRYERGTDVRWIYPLSVESKISIDNFTLTVQNVGTDDEGWYKCVGQHPSKSFRQTFAAELKIAYLSASGPFFIPSPDEDLRQLVVADGSTLRVKCLPPEGLPEPSVHWTAQDKELLPHSGSTRTEADQLVIENMKLASDSKESSVWYKEMKYECMTRNLAGSSSSIITILVTKRPELLEGPKKQQIEESETVILYCKISMALPSLTRVYWVKDGRKLPKNSQRFSLSGFGTEEDYVGDVHKSSLEIKWTHPNDSGAYSCVVSSRGHPDIVSEAADLEIVEKLRFELVPQNSRVKVGSSVSVACKAHSHLQPNITWKRLSNKGLVGALPLGLVNNNGNLTTVRARKSYDGWYLCIASTPHHRPINASVRLMVTEVPHVTIAGGDIITAVQGQAFALQCAASGQPTPYVTWRRTPQMADDWFTDANGTLRSLSVDKTDEGLYTCQASNLVGTATSHITIIVADGVLNHEELKRTVTIVVGCAGAYLGFMVVLLIYCRTIRRKRNKQPSGLSSTLSPGYDTAIRMNNFYISGGNSGPTSLEPLTSMQDSDIKERDNARELSIIYSSRLCNGELQIPENIPKRAKKPNRRDRMKFKKSISMYPHYTATRNQNIDSGGLNRRSMDGTTPWTHHSGLTNKRCESYELQYSTYSDKNDTVCRPYSHACRPPDFSDEMLHRAHHFRSHGS